MTPLPCSRLLLLGAILLTTAPSLAEVFKWTDARGNVHYSDQPPPAGEIGVLPHVLPTHPAREAQAAGEAERKKLSERQTEARMKEALAREADQKKQEALAEEAKRRAENCQRVRKNLETLEKPRSRVARQNAQGQREYLDDTARQAETEKARRDISEYCR